MFVCILNWYSFVTFIETRTFPINNKTRPIRKIPPITPREIARIGAGAGQAETKTDKNIVNDKISIAFEIWTLKGLG